MQNLFHLIFTNPLFNRFLETINSFLAAFYGRLKAVSAYCGSYWTKIYPIALMCWSPLSPPCWPSLPHVLESSGNPPVPNPILESGLSQLFWSLPRIPILALLHWSRPDWHSLLMVSIALNPSLLQLGCKEARDPMSFFHVLRPSEVARYLLSAISEYRDLAGWFMTTDLNSWPIFIPRQILLNGVFQ